MKTTQRETKAYRTRRMGQQERKRDRHSTIYDKRTAQYADGTTKGN